MRIGLHAGVGTNVVNLLITGAGGVAAANATQIGLQIVGYLALLYGASHLVWGITWDSMQWWKGGRIKETWPYGLGGVFLSAAILWGLTTYLNRAPMPPAQPVKALSPALPTDIATTLVIKGFTGSDADGYFEVKNNSSGVVSLGKMLQQVPKIYAQRDGRKLSKTIAKGASLSIPLNDINGLGIIGIARLQFEFDTAGYNAPAKPYMAQFDIGTSVKPGIFTPTNCCDDAINIDYAMNRENQRILDEDPFSKMVFTIEEGHPSVMGSANKSKQFEYMPQTGRVRFAVIQKGQQKIYDAFISKRFPSHLIQISWNDSEATAGLWIDGRQANLVRTIK
jgi:hypothetical protein